MTPEKQPNELNKQPYFLRDTEDLRRRIMIEIKDLEEMAKAGFNETSDGQNISHLIAVRKQFLTQIQTVANGQTPRW